MHINRKNVLIRKQLIEILYSFVCKPPLTDLKSQGCSFKLLCYDISKKNFMAPFYGWGSTTSRLEPLLGGSFLFTTQFPEIPGTHFINLRRMKD